MFVLEAVCPSAVTPLVLRTQLPPSWCQVHHVWHWTTGGPTSRDNGILLCTRHHDLVHPPGRFGLRVEEGRPVFRRPDGSVIQDRAPSDAVVTARWQSVRLHLAPMDLVPGLALSPLVEVPTTIRPSFTARRTSS